MMCVLNMLNMCNISVVRYNFTMAKVYRASWYLQPATDLIEDVAVLENEELGYEQYVFIPWHNPAIIGWHVPKSSGSSNGSNNSSSISDYFITKVCTSHMFLVNIFTLLFNVWVECGSIITGQNEPLKLSAWENLAEHELDSFKPNYSLRVLCT